jgi:acyl-CoA synthetase (AMP-forming)/AMP-acid ligase II
VVAPFSHVAGHKSGILACVVTGAALRPLGAFNADELATLIAAGEASVLQGAPAMYQVLMGAIERRQLVPTAVKVAVAGAAIVSPMLVRRLREVLGVDAVLNGYGLSEATGVCAITRRDDSEEIVTTTCGRPVTGVSLRVVGPDGTELPVGEAGEVEVHGINVMRGYLDDPEATAAAMHEGWLRTGDVGTLDVAGNLRIVDRLKDLVVVGGYNVSPAEVERILAEDPAVRDVAVVGLADERMGEVPVAFVVAADGFDAGAVQARAAERLAGFKVPRRYELIDALPMTAAGKVDKQALRARIASGD